MDETAPLRALVIDDDRMTADTLSQVLRLNGFETTALYSGEQALEWVGTIRPHIVLSDIVLQRVDGIETAMRIRELYPEARVILFTASSLSTAAREKIDSMGFEFMQRPLHPDDILARLRR